MNDISIVTIAKNEEENIKIFLKQFTWVDEIILVDNGSVDKTIEVAKQFTTKVFQNLERNLGVLKQYALSKATKKWILLLDVDEIPTFELTQEIKSTIKIINYFSGYSIPYTNYFLNHKLLAPAFSFSKVRLFKRNFGIVLPFAIHEEVKVKGRVGKLKARLNHYSYRSIPQTLKKFTYYAKEEAPLRYQKGERATLKKFMMYPAHMFWSIFVEDEGYIDGIWGFGLALCFTYYEFMRYVFLWIYQRKKI